MSSEEGSSDARFAQEGQRARNEVLVPPHDLRAERAILGGMLVSQSAVGSIIEKLVAEDFYSETHRVVFRAMQNVNTRQQPIDELTVLDELQRIEEAEKLGGREFLFKLVESVPLSSNLLQYAHIVRSKSLLRDVIDAASVMSQSAMTEPDDVMEVLSEAERLVYGVSHRADGEGRGNLHGIVEVTPNVLETLQRRYESEGAITGVASGFTDLDKITGGFQDDDLIVLGARPAMGKTAFLIGCVEHAASIGIDVALFTLEMSEEDLVERLLSDRSRIELTNLRRGIIEEHQWPRIVRETADIGRLPIHVSDDPTVSVSMMHSRIRRLQSRLEREGRRVGLVVIDYLQLMIGEGKHENRQAEVAKISRGLKILAKESKVPVMVLSQLSRAVEARNDKRPILSDLRDSGAVEQDADVVMFLYREEYYEKEDTDEDLKGIAELDVAKHRSGTTGVVKLAWIPEYTSFENLEHHKTEVF